MNQETAQLLQQIGIEKSDLSWTTQVVLILAILLVSYLTTLIFRHLIMPAVRKITARTKATWDDYLFNDKMMKASCRMIPPITWYILLALVNIVRFMIQGLGYSAFAVIAGICEMVARTIAGFILVLFC